MKNFFSKTLSLILSTVILLSAVSAANIFTVSADTTDSMVYPGGEVRVTYSFAKDIWSTPCYFFEAKYDSDVLEYEKFENHWGITPIVVPHPNYGYVSAVASSAYGVEVKQGDKIISYYYKVNKVANVNDIDFGFNQFQLYDDKGVELDRSYITYSVDVLSCGEEPKKLCGDVDGNGIISIQDATEIQKYIASLVDFTPAQLLLADYNGDGVVNVSDATAIQRTLVNS